MKTQTPDISCLAALRLERRMLCALALLSVLVSALLPGIANAVTAHSDVSFDLSICRGLPGEDDQAGQHGTLDSLACVCVGICSSICGAPRATDLQFAIVLSGATAEYVSSSSGAEHILRGPAFPSLRGPPSFI